MNIAVIGPGAIGLLFACLLKRGGGTVWLLGKEGRKERIDLINRQGIVIHDLQGVNRIMVNATTNPGEIPTPDLAIIAVKAYDTETALRDACMIFGNDTTVLFMQNGIQDPGLLETWAKTKRILLGVTTHASTVVGEGEIIHHSSGNTVVGRDSTSSHSEELVDRLRMLGLMTTHTTNVWGTIWGKAITNSVINPLSAIFRIPNGKLAQMDNVKDLIREIIEEGSNVAEASGILSEPRDLHSFTYDVINRTSSNRSSMLQDLEKRNRTEVDYINGAIEKRGRELGVDVRVNSLLTTLIKRLEDGQNEHDVKTMLLKEALVAN